MKTEIKLTKAQFDRWFKSDAKIDKNDWERLVAETEKPELIEAWAVSYNDGLIVGYCTEKEALENAKTYNGGRVVKLREVPIDGKDGE